MSYNPLLTSEVNVTASTFSADYRGLIKCDCTSNAITVTLPDATKEAGFSYVIKKSDSSVNVVTISTTSSQTIDGLLTRNLVSQFDEIRVFSDGSNWSIIGTYSSGLSFVGFTSATTSATLSASSNCYNLIDASAGAVTLTLNAASGMPAKIFWFKNGTVTGSNSATLQTNGTDTIEGSLTPKTITNLQTIGIISDGVSNWRYLKPQIESPQSGGTGTSVVPTSGQGLIGQSNGTYLPYSNNIEMGILVTGASGATISTGVVGEFRVPFPCSVTGWTLLGQTVSGSCVVDVKKSTYASYPSTTSMVGGGTSPTITSAYSGQNLAISNWTTTTVSAGDIIQFSITSLSSFNILTISLTALRTG